MNIRKKPSWSYRYSFRQGRWVNELEHRVDILLAVKALSWAEVRALLIDTPERRRDMLGHYDELGPDFDDCQPLLLLAEADRAKARGDASHAAYAQRTAEYTRNLLCKRLLKLALPSKVSRALGPN